jgi:transposase
MEVEVITDAGRRRRWTREQKEAILKAAFAPGAVAKVVARQNDIGTGTLYTWRKELWKRVPVVGFSQVVAVAGLAPAQPVPGALAIEVDIGGSKVRIPSTMPPALAAAVIRAMVRR